MFLCFVLLLLLFSPPFPHTVLYFIRAQNHRFGELKRDRRIGLCVRACVRACVCVCVSGGGGGERREAMITFLSRSQHSRTHQID